MWIVAGRTPSGRTIRRLRTITVASTVESKRELATGCTFQERARASPSHELPVLDDHSAPRQHGVCRAGHLAPFVRVVVDVHVQRLRRERDGPVGIEHDDVGVRAWRNRAFAWKEA